MFDINDFNLDKYNEVTARGLCKGVGAQSGQMCIEAAISQAMGLPFNDEPACVEPAVRAYQIRLNDSSRWKSAKSRAAGLYELGIAQLGSAGTVDPVRFARRMAELHTRELVPHIFRLVFADKPELLALADRCEQEGTRAAAAVAANAADASYAANAAAYAANAAAYAANAANAAYTANDAANAAYAADAAYAANAAANAANAANAADAAYAAYAAEKPLLISAAICLRVLREMECPGVALLDKIKATQESANV